MCVCMQHLCIATGIGFLIPRDWVSHPQGLGSSSSDCPLVLVCIVLSQRRFGVGATAWLTVMEVVFSAIVQERAK